MSYVFDKYEGDEEQCDAESDQYSDDDPDDDKKDQNESDVNGLITATTHKLLKKIRSSVKCFRKVSYLGFS